MKKISMQYHTLNEHTFLQHVREGRITKKNTLDKHLLFCSDISEKENLEAKKKAKKTFEKKQHWSDIFFTKKIK